MQARIVTLRAWKRIPSDPILRGIYDGYGEAFETSVIVAVRRIVACDIDV